MADAGVRPSTLTSVLDRLERRGHLMRHARPGDRRAVVIELTESGREAAATVVRVVADLEHHTLDDLPPATITAFRTVLTALTGATR